ncbi:hypothetical protein HBNXHx_0274 [Haloferax volcanii]|nr:hypothetical protein HBNXHx_0274 [Haloferax alexandrinus]
MYFGQVALATHAKRRAATPRPPSLGEGYGVEKERVNISKECVSKAVVDN